MKSACRLVVLTVLALGLLTGTAAAQDQFRKMEPLAQFPNGKINSDFAFWGDHAFAGYYNGPPTNGVRIFDISNPHLRLP